MARPSRVRLCAWLVVLLLLAGCDPPARQAVPPPVATAPSAPGGVDVVGGGTFSWAIAEPEAIVPALAEAGAGVAVADALFDSLTTTDLTGDAAAAAAVTWTSNETATSWTFSLRPGATFHDGTAVTAASFVDGLTAVAASGPTAHLLRDVVGYDAIRRGDVATLVGAEVLNATTLRVGLVRPRADLPIVLSHPTLAPRPGVAAEDPSGFAEQPIGNGPFQMGEPWAHGDFIRVTRWEGWANGARPDDGIGEVLFRISDLDTGFLAFRQGRRDFATVPPEALELAAEQYPPRGGPYSGPGLILGPTAVTYLLVLDRNVPPYDEPGVRQAVSLLVDRTQIAAENAAGNLDVATSLLSPAMSPDSAGVCELCTFNARGGAARLEEAGVSTLTFAFNRGGGHERIRDVLRSDLSDIGISLVSNERRVAPTFSDYLARLQEGDVGMFRLTASADVPSSLDVLYPLLHSSSTPGRGGLNYTGYDSPRVDALLDQASTTLDRTEREGLLRRVEDIVVNRDQVIVPVITYRHAAVAAAGVRGLRYSPFGTIDVAALRLDRAS